MTELFILVAGALLFACSASFYLGVLERKRRGPYVKLEIGGTYRDRRGDLYTVLDNDGGLIYPYTSKNERTGVIFRHTPLGSYLFDNTPTSFDLVEEVKCP